MHRLLAGLFAIALASIGCSSDGDSGAGSPAGRTTTSADEDATRSVRVVTFNALHGLFCPPETDWCKAPDRVAIFGELVEAADCPDLVGLQEIGPRLEQLIPPLVETLCDGEYTIAWQPVNSPDREMVLSRLPILEQGYLDIANFPWEAYWVRVDAPVGPVDFLTTHFASSTNNPDCQPGLCPPICTTGISTNQCHAVEVVDFLERRTGAVMTIVGGDLNARPGSPTLKTLTDAGFVDAWLASGNEECDPETHVGCTGGGDAPEPFVGMDTKEGPGYDARIDFVLVRSSDRCEVDYEAEGFAHEPRATALNGMYWPADHAGVRATLACA
jgi:endonuclease/exonuclease/phosphatase family metal-dependent hydrolase